jgi:hypothetical protein
MHTALVRAGRTGRLLASAVLSAAALTACADQQPLGTRAGQHDDAVPSNAIAALTCTVSVGAGLSCRSQGTPEGGPARDIFGGQNTNVRLSSSNASYDVGTGIFSVDVTVQNLVNEAIGTPDGTTPGAEGITIFFAQEPAATTGTGSVSVANADGTAFFLSANQPYHRYNEVLEKDEVSQPKTWQFQMDPTVGSFSFVVLLAADVDYDLVINEVLANPGGTISDASGEWFEIYNAGSFTVDLQNLVIADSAASGRRPYHLISSSLTVAPGGYVVLGNTTNTTNNGGVPVDYAYGAALALANSLDALKIARVVGTDTLTLDRTQYASAAVSAQNGVSREMTNPGLDNGNMDGSNWADALVTAVYGPGGRGTPKAQNSTFTP